MSLPLIIEVVEEHIMAVEDKTILLISVTTPTKVVVEEVDIDKMEGIIQPTLRSHNVSYVANLIIQFRYVTTYLISPIKALRTVILFL
jgi:hypothetical protein